MKKYFFHWDTLRANVFIFIITGLLALITININVFNPIEKAFKEINFTDIIYKLVQEKNIKDTNIILINVRNENRESIAKMLDIVCKANPKVVGVDIRFSKLRDRKPDSLLRDVINRNKNLVLISTLKKTDKGETVFYSNKYFGNPIYGFENLYSTDTIGIIRNFAPIHNIKGENVLSFASEIVKSYDNNLYNILSERNNKTEIINYKGNKNAFITLYPEDLFNKNFQSIFHSKLMDKIVLMGYLGDYKNSPYTIEDKHFTPLNPKLFGKSYPDMYGVEIHANIISTIINKEYINKSATWLNWLVAFIICYVHLVVFMYFYIEKHKWFHLTAKTIQLATSVLVVWVMLILFNEFNYYFDSFFTITTIILSVDLLYFYDGFIKLFNKLFGLNTLFINHK